MLSHPCSIAFVSAQPFRKSAIDHMTNKYGSLQDSSASEIALTFSIIQQTNNSMTLSIATKNWKPERHLLCYLVSKQRKERCKRHHGSPTHYFPPCDILIFFGTADHPAQRNISPDECSTKMQQHNITKNVANNLKKKKRKAE